MKPRMDKRAAMYERITRHGRQLLAMFPSAEEQDPVKLCKALRKLEVRGNYLATQYCNGKLNETQYILKSDKVLCDARIILGDEFKGRVWDNSDPRGYFLKVDLLPGEELHRDWGGNGIIAPDLTEEP